MLAKYFYDSMSRFWSMTSLVTSFCSISLISPHNRLFGQLDLNFTKYLQGVKLFNMTWGTLWQNPLLIPCHIFDLWRQLWRHLALSHLFVYLIAILSNLTWFLRNIYMSKIVQQDLRNILTKYLFDAMSRFWLMTSFVDVILLYFTNFPT